MLDVLLLIIKINNPLRIQYFTKLLWNIKEVIQFLLIKNKATMEVVKTPTNNILLKFLFIYIIYNKLKINYNKINP